MLGRGRPKKRDSITHDLLVPSIGGTGELEFLGFLIATIWTLQLIKRRCVSGGRGWPTIREQKLLRLEFNKDEVAGR